MLSETRPPLIVGISSRALFSLDESNAVFEKDGLAAYSEYQIAHEDEPLEPGDAFPLVQKLLAIDASLGGGRVEVLLLSRNSADTGLRIFRSMDHYGLDIRRAAFCGGESPYRYAIAFDCRLFLSTHSDDVADALAHGIASATILPSKRKQKSSEMTDQLRIAFDGDAVLFSDEAERIYEEQGLTGFEAHERDLAHSPLHDGPFKPFLAALHEIQKEFSRTKCPIRTALVTARGAPAHERVIRTLRAWDIRLDESLFLSGAEKGPFLAAFGADIFFDDQTRHCEAAVEHVAAGHVPRGGLE